MKPTTQIHAYVLVAIILVVAALSFLVIKPYVVTLALAGIFAVALYPLYRSVLKRVGDHRGIAALITEIIAIICVLIPVTLIGIQVTGEAERIVSYLASPESTMNIKGQALRVTESIGSVIPGSDIYVSQAIDRARQAAEEAFTWILSNGAYALTQTFSLFLSLFIFLIALYYFLKDAPRMGSHLVKISPFNKEETTALSHRLVKTVHSVVQGNLTISLIQAVMATIGFTIFGIPNALVWGIITGLAGLVPGIGTALVLVPATLFLFITLHTQAAIGLLLWSLTAIGLIDNIFAPKLVGGKAEIHPVLVMVAVLGGISFFGPAGIFLGPLLVSLLIGLLEIYAPESK